MKRILLLLPLLLAAGLAFSQHTFRAVIKDSASNEPVTGVTGVVKGSTNGAVSDDKGVLEITNISEGTQTIILSLVGYDTREYNVTLPQTTEPVTVWMQGTAAKMNEIIVEGTRSNRSIANIPTRVEVLTEEIDEASSMDPSKVAHLLTHSTGIQVQQTSATSNTANVRIQGLDGRYTQILKDGFPLYGGFSGSLSIMQIPPLDLRQVEYIKGSASTLYGGGAIAGLINLISKEPSGNETLLHLNASQIGAFDVNAFVSRRIKKVGFTMLAQRNSHLYFDADNDRYTDMPALTKYNFNPKLFYYFSDNTKISLGATFTKEEREGGDIIRLSSRQVSRYNFYNEANDVNRATTQLKFDHRINNKFSVTLRNSFNFFDRSLTITPTPDLVQYNFAGKQLSSFSEAALTMKHKENVLIAGINYYSDDFKETSVDSFIPKRNETYKTMGAFANYTFDIGKRVSIESGLRADYVLDEEALLLPRIAALFKWTDKLTTRIGGGLGYRNPTIFNQESELIGYRNVMPIDKKYTKAERSYGSNADIGYRTRLGKHFFLNINQMFFYTHLDKPLALVYPGPGFSSGNPFFTNIGGFARSYGSETFFKFGFYDFVFFAGYTYTNATTHFASSATTEFTLTPKHSLKGDLLYSIPGKWRIGADYEFKSGQLLSSGIRTPSYWTFGALVEYTWKHITLFGNVENFTNVRQTKYDSLRSRPFDTPQFTEVWAPLDGIVVNGGIKLRW
ncbi:MAG: TonB-dependent receptor [Sphingobacteriales bacterium]|nr:MAG: TonB-dependent receptor [Sphingobacteriales bacterium]